MKPFVAIALLVLPAALVAAKPAAGPEDAPPERIVMKFVQGSEACPKSSDEEIIVCAREDPADQYRIPKALRKKKHDDVQNSWTDRVRTLDMVSQRGLPNSCSPEGSNGQTGCLHQFLEQARAEREAARKGQ